MFEEEVDKKDKGNGRATKKKESNKVKKEERERSKKEINWAKRKEERRALGGRKRRFDG